MYPMPAGMAQALSGPHQIRTYAVIYARPWPPHTAAQARANPWAWVGTQVGVRVRVADLGDTIPLGPTITP